MSKALNGFMFSVCVVVGMSARAQVSSDACSYAVANQYPVGTSCVFMAFTKPTAFLPNYDPGSCNSSNNDDAYGWFQATGTITTVTYDPPNAGDPVLHVLTGPCGGPYTEIACADDGIAGDNETVTLPTTPGTSYLIRIQNYSTNAAMNGQICIYTTPPPPPACGTTVYDPGGAGANYANNAAFTATYCPINVGDAVTLTFTTFNTENGFDFVSLYDGPSTGSPLIGTWSGTNTPGVVTSTNPSGCITLEFTSDFTTTRPGWAINVTCGTPPPPLYVCGTTIYDIGGAAGNYSNNQNTVVTYCPSVPGEVVSLDFSAFSVTAPDVLTVYDGPNISAPVLGSYAGTGLPGTVTATNPGGCITVRFFSNANTVSTGWAATLTCIPPPPPPAGDCVYALALYDSNGNGWGSSSVGVSINNGPFTNYTVTGTFNQVLIGVHIGDVIVLNYNATGPNQGQNSFALSIQGQTTICSGGPSPAAGLQCIHTVNCVPPPNPPTDCSGGATLCTGQGFNNNSDNSGNVEDLSGANQGCLASGERQGTWYYFSPSAAGTIGFTITPSVPTDYDFALWGPSTIVTCPPNTSPLRCSYSGLIGNTGLGNGAVDQSEGAGGDAFVQTITVTAAEVGKIYVLYVDNFSSNGQAFNLTWQLTAGASLDCTVLPIELLSFRAYGVEEGVNLKWATATEQNSDRFEIERSIDGEHFELIGTLPSAGNSMQELHYDFLDRLPYQGLNHYRLRHVDIDGDEQHSPVESVYVERNGKDQVLLIPNPGNGQVQVILPENAAGSIFVMMDAVGQEVMRARTEGARMSLDMSRLVHGVYGYRLLSPAGAILAHGTWMRE